MTFTSAIIQDFYDELVPMFGDVHELGLTIMGIGLVVWGLMFVIRCGRRGTRA